MNIVAFIPVYNEEVIIGRCLRHLRDQGVGAYLFDNESTDDTVKIARTFLGRGVVAVETMPRNDGFGRAPILRRVEQLSESLGADWYVFQDADEIREAPPPFQTLAQGIEAADHDGYNAINFHEFAFMPTSDEDDAYNDHYVERLNQYYFVEEKPFFHIKAWKNVGQRIDLMTEVGHRVRFAGRRLYPLNFVMRHYICLSREHARRKYAGRRFPAGEVTKGWHNTRVGIDVEKIQFPPQSQLHCLSVERKFDRSWPLREHLIFQNARPKATPATSPVPTRVQIQPKLCIVGDDESGASAVCGMLDCHPDLALSAEYDLLAEAELTNRLSLRLKCKLFSRAIQHRRHSGRSITRRIAAKALNILYTKDLGVALWAYYGVMALASGKRWWGVRIRPATNGLQFIGQQFGDIPFVYLIRDGRDLLCSEDTTMISVQSTREFAERWLADVMRIRGQAESVGRYLEVRYEDLIVQPTKTIRDICEFIELPLNSNAVVASTTATPDEPGGMDIGRWKRALTPEQIRGFQDATEPLLRDMGYEVV